MTDDPIGDAVELIAAELDGSISEWVEVRTGPYGYEADPRVLARIAVEALEMRPDVLAALAARIPAACMEDHPMTTPPPDEGPVIVTRTGLAPDGSR